MRLFALARHRHHRVSCRAIPTCRLRFRAARCRPFYLALGLCTPHGFCLSTHQTLSTSGPTRREEQLRREDCKAATLRTQDG